ncbi:MAG: hypothetical protein J6336_12830 [Kiritimatiellae bacterium]|nr:hypothetical protein [Kiritimatiellia bacterium]
MSADVKTSEESRGVRLARWAFAVLVPMALAAAVTAVTLRWFGDRVLGGGVPGVCRELLAGSTQGRQALYGSCWRGPLFPLFHLPFAWLLPSGWAIIGSTFTAWLFLFLSVRQCLKRYARGWHPLFLAPQIALAVIALAMRSPALAAVQVPLTAGFYLLAAAGLAEWAETREVRSVVATGVAAAFLLLCGAVCFIPAALFLLSIPLLACGDSASRRRIQAWVLLGWLPALYAFGVWMLMNRLVLGDALFFLRSIPGMAAGQRTGLWLLLSVPFLWLPAYLTTWIQEGNPSRRGSWMAVLLVAGVAVAALAILFAALGWRWPRESLFFCAYAVLLAAISRGPKKAFNYSVIYGMMLLAVIAGAGFFASKATAALDDPRKGETSPEELCAAIERYVTEKSPYARVFVMGYDGLELLRSYSGERLTPNMDLHLFSLRQAYKGQHLFVLMPKPEGVTRTESLFWRYPDIYAKGIDRLLVDRDFGDWRLYECVVAPTREQLDAWRK